MLNDLMQMQTSMHLQARAFYYLWDEMQSQTFFSQLQHSFEMKAVLLLTEWFATASKRSDKMPCMKNSIRVTT